MPSFIEPFYQFYLLPANCFALNDPLAVTGNKIILVDDVVTSGATLRSAATVLKNNGAKDIIALVVAKAGF